MADVDWWRDKATTEADDFDREMGITGKKLS